MRRFALLALLLSACSPDLPVSETTPDAVLEAGIRMHRLAHIYRDQDFYLEALFNYDTYLELFPGEENVDQVRFYRAEAMWVRAKETGAWAETASAYAEVSASVDLDARFLREAALSLALAREKALLASFDEQGRPGREVPSDLSEPARRFVESCEAMLDRFPESRDAHWAAIQIAHVYSTFGQVGEACARFEQFPRDHRGDVRFPGDCHSYRVPKECH